MAAKENRRKHLQQRYDKYISKIKKAKELGCPLRSITNYGIAPWVDNSSPTGLSQICDYLGICQYPCNGDC